MKMKLSILLFIVVMFMFVGCNKADDSINSTESNSTAQTPTSSKESSTTQTSIDYSIFSEPESAYAAFIRNLFSGDEDPKNLYERDYLDYYDSDDKWNTMEFYFVLKDLDNDGTSELVIMTNWMNVAVYTYSDGLMKIGSRNFASGTTRLFFSDNPAYPGIFFFFVGGGLEHYGYISIKDNQFIYEDLWNEDYSGFFVERDGRNRIEELSNDKELIEESRIVYRENNDIDWMVHTVRATTP